MLKNHILFLIIVLQVYAGMLADKGFRIKFSQLHCKDKLKISQPV